MDLSYYDKEIIVGDSSNIHSLSSRSEVQLRRISSKNRFVNNSFKEHKEQSPENLSSDDDGLLQNIADEDNDDDDDDVDINDNDEKNNSNEITKSNINLQFPIRNLQSKISTASSNAKNFLSTTRTTLGNYMESPRKEFQTLQDDNLDVDNDDSTINLQVQRSRISVEKWEKLLVHQDIKDLFPYILKYIPQPIEITYQLQPFIPDYIPAVGDVDAFLKVTQPKVIPNIGDSKIISQHFQNLGLTVVDEPSEDQSEPSLLAMKLRSTLSGGGMISSKASSAFMGPVVKTSRDIDKWVQEIENVHSSQFFLDIQAHKDIDDILMSWPSIDNDVIKEAYQRGLSGQCDLLEYLQILFQQFGMTESLKTHADYLINIRTLFSLYLFINQI